MVPYLGLLRVILSSLMRNLEDLFDILTYFKIFVSRLGTCLLPCLCILYLFLLENCLDITRCRMHFHNPLSQSLVNKIIEDTILSRFKAERKAIAYGLMEISWVMTGSRREEIWGSRGINREKKLVSFIPLTIFRIVWIEKNMRAFKMVKDEFDRVRGRWFQTLDFLVMDHPLSEMVDFWDIIDILINI